MKYERMTNVEFVKELMQGYNEHGALAQLVFIQALGKGLELMNNDKDELLEQYEQDEKDGKVGFIHIPSWVECTEDMLMKYKSKYETS